MTFFSIYYRCKIVRVMQFPVESHYFKCAIDVVHSAKLLLLLMLFFPHYCWKFLSIFFITIIIIIIATLCFKSELVALFEKAQQCIGGLVIQNYSEDFCLQSLLFRYFVRLCSFSSQDSLFLGKIMHTFHCFHLFNYELSH